MESRPKINIQKTQMQKWINIISLILLGITTIYLLLNYPKMPNEIPLHFNLFGEEDYWGPKWTIFILWGIGIIIYLLNTKTQSFPHKFNYIVEITEKNAEKQYHLAVKMMSILGLEIMILITYLHLTIISTVQLNVYFMFILVMILFSTLGVYMVDSRKYR